MLILAHKQPSPAHQCAEVGVHPCARALAQKKRTRRTTSYSQGTQWKVLLEWWAAPGPRDSHSSSGGTRCCSRARRLRPADLAPSHTHAHTHAHTHTRASAKRPGRSGQFRKEIGKSQLCSLRHALSLEDPFDTQRRPVQGVRSIRLPRNSPQSHPLKPRRPKCSALLRANAHQRVRLCSDVSAATAHRKAGLGRGQGARGQGGRGQGRAGQGRARLGTSAVTARDRQTDSAPNGSLRRQSLTNVVARDQSPARYASHADLKS